MIIAPGPPRTATVAHEATFAGVDPALGVDVLGVSTTRSLGGNLPGAEGSGSPGASGTLSVLTPGYGLEPSPWARRGGWPSRPGTRVSCSVGTVEAGVFPVLTGTVRSVSPSGGGVLNVDVTDPMDPLTRVVSVPALASSMPPAVVGGALLRPGLSADYVANRVLRACGVWNTPLMPSGMVGVSVPLQGAAHPERGTCVEVSAVDQPVALASFNDAPWGTAATSMDGTYLPSGTAVAAVGIGVMVAPTHAATSVITLDRPGGVLNLTVNSARQVTLAGPSGSVVLPGAPGWERVRADVTSGGQGTLTDDTGRTATGVVGGASSLTSVRVRAEVGSRIAGVMVGSNIGSGYLTGTPNLVMAASPTLTTGMLACPVILSRPVIEVLHEIATATLRTWWWGEDGVLRWWPADRLLDAPPVAEVTTTDHVADYAWDDSLDRHHRAVVVQHRVILDRLLSKWPDLEVWRGNGAAIDIPSERRVEFVTVPDDEVWIGVHDQDVPLVVQEGGQRTAQYNIGRGSFVGGVVIDPDGGEKWTTHDSFPVNYLTTTINRVTSGVWKIEHTAAPGLPAGHTVVARTPGLNATVTGLWSHRLDEALPVLRAHYRATVIDAQTASSMAADAPNAQDYIHEGGIWVQGYNTELPQVYADWLAARVLDPPALVTGLEVNHDPRRQVGDCITAVDTHRYGVTVTGVIVSLSQSSQVSDGTAEQSMTLDLIVTSPPVVAATWGDAQDAHGGTWGEAQSTGGTWGEAQGDAAPETDGVSTVPYEDAGEINLKLIKAGDMQAEPEAM